MIDKVRKCPACSQELKFIDSIRGDWITYQCPAHGEFNLSKTLSVILARNPEASRNVAYYLDNMPERADIICTYDVGLAQ